jgi:hypothetical protein
VDSTLDPHDPVSGEVERIVGTLVRDRLDHPDTIAAEDRQEIRKRRPEDPLDSRRRTARKPPTIATPFR